MRKFDITSLVRGNILALQAYQAKDIPCRVKLDANESPYGLSLQEILGQEGATVDLNRYPDPEARRLRAIVADHFGVGGGNILFGNGSDELITYLVLTFGGPVLYPVPTFSMYGIISKAVGERPIEVPLDGSFDIDTKKMLAAVRDENPKIVFLSSPNNPTGNAFSRDRMMQIVRACQGIVVIDEAYQPFSRKKSLLPVIKEHRNAVIMKTVSKIGFAALRLGFLIAGEEIVNEVNKVRLPYNVNSLSQLLAAEAFNRAPLIQKSAGSIMKERERLFAALRKMRGITPYPSDANFILFKVSNAGDFYAKLLESGILVRNMSGVIKDTLRVTVGTPAENTAFLDAARDALRR